MLRLNVTVTSPEQSQPRTLLIDRFPMRLGRTPDNDLALPFSSVSSRHLAIDQDGDNALLITDLGSTNGTHLPDRALIPHQPQPVTLPCELRLGDVRLAISSIYSEADEGFTSNHSETELRQLLDQVVRQTQPEDDTLPFFEILSGPGTGHRYFIRIDGRPALIGTTADADIQLQLPDLPAELAEITWQKTHYHLTPKTSQLTHNGRCIDGAHPLSSGDRFVLDILEFLFFDPLEDTLRAMHAGLPTSQTPPSSPAPTPTTEPADSPSAAEIPTDTDSSEISGVVDPMLTADEAPPEKNQPRLGAIEIAILTMSLFFLVGAVALLWIVL